MATQRNQSPPREITEAKNNARKSRLRRSKDRLALRPAPGTGAVVSVSSTAARKGTGAGGCLLDDRADPQAREQERHREQEEDPHEHGEPPGRSHEVIVEHDHPPLHRLVQNARMASDT